MNYEYLNNMIQYIEKHLTEKIEYKKLASLVGISEYSLQRVFLQYLSQGHLKIYLV